MWQQASLNYTLPSLNWFHTYEVRTLIDICKTTRSTKHYVKIAKRNKTTGRIIETIRTVKWRRRMRQNTTTHTIIRKLYVKVDMEAGSPYPYYAKITNDFGTLFKKTHKVQGSGRPMSESSLILAKGKRCKSINWLKKREGAIHTPLALIGTIADY